MQINRSSDLQVLVDVDKRQIKQQINRNHLLPAGCSLISRYVAGLRCPSATSHTPPPPSSPAAMAPARTLVTALAAAYLCADALAFAPSRRAGLPSVGPRRTVGPRSTPMTTPSMALFDGRRRHSHRHRHYQHRQHRHCPSPTGTWAGMCYHSQHQHCSRRRHEHCQTWPTDSAAWSAEAARWRRSRRSRRWSSSPTSNWRRSRPRWRWC